MHATSHPARCKPEHFNYLPRITFIDVARSHKVRDTQAALSQTRTIKWSAVTLHASC
jgi:hypothetical protein